LKPTKPVALLSSNLFLLFGRDLQWYQCDESGLVQNQAKY